MIIGRLFFKIRLFVFICYLYLFVHFLGTKMSENGRGYLIRFNDGKIDFIAANVVQVSESSLRLFGEKNRICQASPGDFG